MGEDIASWGDFFIVGDEASKEVVIEIQIFLTSFLKYDVNNVEFLGEDFIKRICDEDCLLVISKSSSEDSIMTYVEIAKSRDAKVYGVFGDKGNLALMADEVIVLENDFDNDVQSIKEAIIAIAYANSEMYDTEIQEPHPGFHR